MNAAPDLTDRYERQLDRIIEILPYLLLGGAPAAALLQPGQTPGDRLVTAGLAAAAAVWVQVTFTRRPASWRGRTLPALVYLAGVLALGGVLGARSAFFIAFIATGFIHAFFVLPPRPAFAVVAATSFVIYTAPIGFPEPTIEGWSWYLFIIAFQTLITGFFSYNGIKLTEQHELRRKLVADLEAALEENAGLHVQLLTQAREAGRLDERQRLARDIHDTLAQGLTGIVTQLEAARRAGARRERWEDHVDRARTLARASLSEARRSVQALGPEPLEGSRLPEAIAGLAADWSETSGVPLAFETTGDPRPLVAELEVTLYRVAQEALTNVARHAAASKVGVTLSYVDDMVLLDVRDDGIGFVPGGPRTRGFGLSAMGQRLRRVAGELEIESTPGEGTAVNARVPLIVADRV
jgi:signal transduction histidine kinase